MDEENKDLPIDKKAADQPESTPAEKTYTEAEVKAQLQSETDKRVSQALQTAKEKWETDYKAQLQTEKSEAEKLATMTAEQKAQAELEKQRTSFEQERKSFLKEKLELQTIKELSSEGLPTGFSSYVMSETAEDTSTNIQTFKSEWEKAIEQAVDERLKGRTPAAATSVGSSITKEQFVKLGYKERAKLLEENPALYDSLKGQLLFSATKPMATKKNRTYLKGENKNGYY